MKNFETIRLYRGATSEVEFDFSDFEFGDNSECLLTIKEMESEEVVFTYEFTEPKKYTVQFEDNFTINLKEDEYRYDIMYLINDERYPQCKPSKVKVNEVVGSYESN